MTHLSIPHYRLGIQGLTGKKFSTPAEVVGWFGAVQAQDYLGSLWAIGLRLKNGTEQAVEKALADKLIVRSYPMRGTLHFVLPNDLRWMLKLLTPRIIARSETQYKQAGLDAATFRRAAKIFEKALTDSPVLTRIEMYELLERAKISTAVQRGLHIIGKLSQQGLLCYGPRQGKQQTFALLDDWLPPGRALNREESMAELAVRYVTSHGPATVHDFCWWSGLSPADARISFELIKSQCMQEVIDGKTYFLKGDASSRKVSSSLLLPAYDEYTVAYKDRSAILDDKYIARTGSGIFKPVFIVDGQIAGAWQRFIRKDSVDIHVKAFHDKAKAMIKPGMEKEYAKFIGLPVRIKIVR